MRILNARQSYTGKSLTDAQFDESWAVAGIMEREIRKTGSFREKLTDYAHAFSRSEKFDAMKGETIIRDMFKSRYDQTMNQMRETIQERENTVKQVAPEKALEHAKQVPDLIEQGETMPFYRAYDIQARALSEDLGVTETGAKTMMKDAYQSATGRDLYEDGKAAEKTFHEPAREAEREARQEQKALQTREGNGYAAPKRSMA